MKKIVILGAGMVGTAIAKDLSSAFQVIAIDINEENLSQLALSHSSIQTIQANLQDYTAYPKLLEEADWVVTAVPGFMGYKTLEAVINAGKSAVDISFFPENALNLDEAAKKAGVTIVTDCGVAPGMSNLILGRYDATMHVEKFLCYVGGLPKERKPPFQYKAPFSPVDVLEEYTRPARLKLKDGITIRPALSDRELLSFPPVGELEAFNTDGLRSLLFTMPHIPEMIEKTLRYPGHINLIIALQQAGFFSTEEIVVNGMSIKPMGLTTQLLLRQWKLEPGEAEFTIMQVIVEGKRKRVQYDLYDEYDAVSGISSMARTTGYTCTAAVHLLAKGMFMEKGVFPPEIVGKNEACFEFVLEYLRERGVVWKASHSEI